MSIMVCTVIGHEQVGLRWLCRVTSACHSKRLARTALDVTAGRTHTHQQKHGGQLLPLLSKHPQLLVRGSNTRL
jgi:hypothetical protein